MLDQSEIIELVKSNGFSVDSITRDMVFFSEQSGWKARLSSLTFTVTKDSNEYCVRARLDKIAKFFETGTHMFSLDQKFMPEETSNSAPEVTPDGETPQPTPESKSEDKAPKAPKEKRVSALGIMRKMIAEGKQKEEILDTLVPLFPNRTRVSLSGQLSSTISATKKSVAPQSKSNEPNN